ncbi:hypothetical protein [Bremerella sp.]|uniref:hypothetical protein n=1 Tax=Bremerella sp. TaxID=2795602 RepID=UPI00391C7A53
MIEKAKRSIREWPSDDPRDLAIVVASLCRDVLDEGDLPEGDHDWRQLRESFDIAQGSSIAATIMRWDELCRLGDFDTSVHDSYVKLGIVTWSVKKLVLKLGMFRDPSAAQTDLEEWKTSLIHCLDKYILV